MNNKILDNQQNAEQKIEQNEEDVVEKEEWPITPDDEDEYFNAKNKLTDEQMSEEISEEITDEQMSEEITDEQMSEEIVNTKSNNFLEQSTNEFDFGYIDF